MNAVPSCSYCRLPITGWNGDATPSASTARYCCYGCRLAAAITGDASRSVPVTLLTRLGIAVALSMAVMAFSLPLYSPDVYGHHETATTFAAALLDVLQYTSLLLSVVVFVLLGLPILSSAIDDVRRWIAGADALVVVGVAATLAYSAHATVRGSTQTYYETSCLVLVLFTFGRYLEALGRHRASTAIESLRSLLPSDVEITRGGRSQTAALETLRIGDRVHVPAGQTICVDGQVESGQAHVDEHLVTGEHEPLFKKRGDPVRAGTTALDAGLTIEATAVGTDSTVGRLGSLLEAARQSRGRYQQIADRVSTLFLPLVVIVAMGTCAAYAIRGDFRHGLLCGLAVLLISCPCALGIATPMAMWLALSKAADRGVLFVGGTSVERLAGVRAVAFDKTGTLSNGEPRIVQFQTETGLMEDDRRVLAIAAGLSRGSMHAYSRAIVHYAADRQVEPFATDHVSVVNGAGLSGAVQHQSAQIGNVRMMEASGATFGPALRDVRARVVERGLGLACVSVNGRVLGVFAFAEQLRPEARPAIEHLRKLACRIRVLTGDHHVRGAAVAQELGVDILADLPPDQKVDEVRRLRREAGPVAMVGDGLNDAPALAAADVGVAMGCGPDLTRRAADVCLLGNDLQMIPAAIQLARRTVLTIRINLLWAFAYNLVAIPMAVIGTLRPVYAAIAMVLSSLFVVTNTLGLERLDKRKPS